MKYNRVFILKYVYAILMISVLIIYNFSGKEIHEIKIQ
jgi:hypothetical protein